MFYGEKGGALSDKGTINGLEVIELKWDNDTLLHKVNGKLTNPIKMVVDMETRYVNTAVQSAFHILDGYYAKLGLYIPAIGVNPDNQWYEVNSKDIDENHLNEVQNFMNKVINDDIPVSFTYINGKDYPDEKYQKFDELRIVEFQGLDKQPCGTLHVNSTSQIQSFVVLDFEKTSRGTRIYVACNLATNSKLKAYHNILKNVSHKLNVPKTEIEINIEALSNNNKLYKKEIESLKKQLIDFKVIEYINNPNTIIEASFDNQGELRNIAQALIGKIKENKFIVSSINDEVNFAIISGNDSAREILEKIKDKTIIQGGGSPKMVCAKTNISKEEFLEIIKTI